MVVKCAFTLAETLITLVIVGVIAAITVPTLMNKINKQDIVSRLKKAHSTLAQATNMIIAEEGTPKVNAGGWSYSTDNVYRLYKKYLLNAKACAPGENSNECFIQEQYKLLRGDYSDVLNGQVNEYPKFVMADGTQIIFTAATSDATKDCAFVNNQTNKTCFEVYVDLNGARKPNQFGRDVFVFSVQEKGLYPMGCDEDKDHPACNNVDTGWGLDCACRVIREGTINY